MPPMAGQALEPCPSPSPSWVAWTHMPGAMPEQVPSWQALPSLQEGTAPGPQSVVALQTSAPLQKLPSWQTALLGVWTHAAIALLHVSTVQRMPSLHVGAMPARHCMRKHVSAPLQNIPSEHSAFVPPGQVRQSGSMPSQSWSMPSPQISIGGTQTPAVQVGLHERVPVVPHVVVQGVTASATHAKPSSAAPLQLSSTPLQISTGGEHTLHAHVAPHTREPELAQVVMHVPVSPEAHVNVSSICMLQLSSMPLQISGAPGCTPALMSLQSSFSTVPNIGHVASP